MEQKKVNKRDKIFKFISYIAGILALILTVGKTFDEGGIVSKVLSNLYYFYIEIPILLLIASLLYFSEFLSPFFKRIYIFLIKDKIRFGLIILSIFLFLFINYKDILTIAKERLHHAKQWQNPDKYNTYQKICGHFRACKFDLIEEDIRGLYAKYPEEAPVLDRLIFDLNQSKEISESLFFMQEFFEDDLKNYREIERDRHIKSIIAYSYFPNSDHKRLLSKDLKILVEGLKEADTFYTLLKSNDQNKASKIYTKWRWFLFDDYIRHLISTQSSDDVKSFYQMFIKNVTKDEYLTILEDNWRIRELKDLLVWKPSIHVGKSWEYYSK